MDTLRQQASRKENIVHDFEMLLEARTTLDGQEINIADAMKLGFNTAFGSVNKIIDPDLRERILGKVIPNTVDPAWKAAIIKEIRDKCDHMLGVADSFESVSQIRNTVTERNKGEWKPTEEEKTQFEESRGAWRSIGRRSPHRNDRFDPRIDGASTV